MTDTLRRCTPHHPIQRYLTCTSQYDLSSAVALAAHFTASFLEPRCAVDKDVSTTFHAAQLKKAIRFMPKHEICKASPFSCCSLLFCEEAGQLSPFGNQIQCRFPWAAGLSGPSPARTTCDGSHVVESVTVTEACQLACTRVVLVPVCEELEAAFPAKALQHSWNQNSLHRA